MAFYCYLHGFASSPRSAKAQALGDRFKSLGLTLTTPDLNQGNFAQLTLTRQLQQVANLFPSPSIPVTIIGSSLGGLTAAWLAEQHLQVQRLVLLAPAFDFLEHWLPRLGKDQVQQWQQTNSLEVYHYGEDRMLPLQYDFVPDATQYQANKLQRPVPTLILHGIADDVIPIQASRNYVARRSWAKLVELESDHTLGNVEAQIWQETRTFLEI